jgi:hypothetical protein
MIKFKLQDEVFYLHVNFFENFEGVNYYFSFGKVIKIIHSEESISYKIICDDRTQIEIEGRDLHAIKDFEKLKHKIIAKKKKELVKRFNREIKDYKVKIHNIKNTIQEIKQDTFTHDNMVI